MRKAVVLSLVWIGMGCGSPDKNAAVEPKPPVVSSNMDMKMLTKLSENVFDASLFEEWGLSGDWTLERQGREELVAFQLDAGGLALQTPGGVFRGGLASDSDVLVLIYQWQAPGPPTRTVLNLSKAEGLFQGHLQVLGGDVSEPEAIAMKPAQK